MMKRIVFKDNFRKNIADKLECTTEKRPRGQVQVFEQDKKIIDTSNLVVYVGREWLIQRALNKARAGDGGHNSPNSFISWFGLGTGGAGPSVLIPIVPVLTDTELYNPIIINNKVGTPCIDDGKKHPLDLIEFLEDTSNENKYLITRITVNIGSDDANGPLGGTGVSDYYDINEAGLYVSDSSVQSDFTGPSGAAHLATLQLFARVTFSTIRKYSERSISFVWYLYF